MLALYRCGRQAEALEAYRRARATLVEDVGVEPGAELRDLHEAILGQDPALDLPPQRLPAALEGGSPLLAGRDRELAQLRERLAEARAGRGGAVLVRGPPGIGKTRLAAELARTALREGMVVRYFGAEAAARVRGTRSDRWPPGPDRARRAESRAAPPGDGPCPGGPQSALPRSADRARRARGRPGDRAGAAGAGGGGRDRGPLPAAGRRSGPGRRERRHPRRRASPRRRPGAGAGSRGTGRERRSHRRGAKGPASGRGGPRGRRARPAGGGRTRPPPRARCGRRTRAGGVPLPGPHSVRRGPGRVLLRARAARRGAGGPAGRLPAPGGDRAVGKREVLRGAGGPAAGAGRRRPTGLRAMAPGADAAGRTPAERARTDVADGRRSRAAGGRPVRGGVHGLPR